MKLILLFFLCLTSFIARAQQTAVDLDPVSVTATIHPERVSMTGRNIIIIPGGQMNQLPVHSIDELLRYVPGVEVQSRGPAGSQSDIVLRGGTFQQVLVILDGIRLNDPNTGHFNSYIPISPAEIDRIEVLKGASAAIYGSEAVGGVINIMTKSFAAKSKQQQKLFNTGITAGQYNLLNIDAGGYWQKNNTAIGGGFLSNYSDGQPQRGTRGYFNNQTASLSIKQFITDKLSVSFRSAYGKRKFAAQNFYTNFVSDTASEKVTSYWNQASINFQTGKHTLNLEAGYKSVKDMYLYNAGSTPNNNRSNLLQFLLTDQFQLTTKSALTTGLQYQNKKIRSNDRGDHTLSQAAYFMILSQQLGKFSISPSLRVDYSGQRGTELVPQLNGSYHQGKWQLRASAGKTIRDADFTERYNNYNKSFVSGGSIGNPDLAEERSLSYEAGADYFAAKNLKLSSGIFQRRQSQLIDWVPTPYSGMPAREHLSPTGTYALAKNIAKVNTTGIETDVQFEKDYGNQHHLFATLGLVWLQSRSSDTVPSFYLASHAKFLANFNTSYTTKRFSISINGVYKNRNPQKATAISAEVKANCFVLNARAGISLWKQQLSIFIEADNCLNSNYSDLLGSQMPGRWLMTGIKFQFK